MHKKILIAVVALGLLVGTTGQVGAVASTTTQTLDGDSVNSITDVSSDLTVDAGYLSAGVLSHECFSEDGDEQSSCEHT
jgi:hypothetical protein